MPREKTLAERNAWNENRAEQRREKRPGRPLVAVLAADTGNGVNAAPAPPRAPVGRKAATLPAAELVAIAVAIDRVLAMPGDAVGWRLRMRLDEARKLLNVPDYPTLDAAQVREVDPEPPTPDLIERRPGLAPRAPVATGDAQAQAIIRGIRSERIKTLAKRALAAGYVLEMTGSGHLAIASASDGRRLMVVSTTAADSRRGHTWGNVRAQAKRVGIDVTGL